MNVVIEALGIDRLGGGRSATLGLLRALLPADRDNRYTLVLTRREPTLCQWTNARQVISGQMPATIARVWAQLAVPIIAQRTRADVVHHAKNLAVLGCPCPTVVTIYDLTILSYPSFFPRFDRWYWNNVQPRLLRKADRVIAISEATARDLQRHYRLSPAGIDVIYPALNPLFARPRLDDDAIRARYDLRGDYVLHVGSISLKKNLGTLIRAFERVRADGVELKLALVGRIFQKGTDRSIETLIQSSRFTDDIRLTGPVPDDDLPSLYHAATAVVFPSLHEGFGIVPVEAMASGAPVIASTGGALSEVVGDGGFLLGDARDSVELATAITRVARDNQLRAELVRRGRERAADFSPAETARRHLDLYEHLAARPGARR